MLTLGLFMFSFKNKLLPVGFHDMFLSSSQLHSYNTRNGGGEGRGGGGNGGTNTAKPYRITKKPQTAMKLPENFLILQTAWFCTTASYRNLK